MPCLLAAALCRQSGGFVQYQDMIVADYLDFAAELKGLRGAAKAAELRRVVGATEIGDKLLAPIATLSRGFKQRVGVAQAILARPRLLIMDEPTNGLDPTQTEWRPINGRL